MAPRRPRRLDVAPTRNEVRDEGGPAQDDVRDEAAFVRAYHRHLSSVTAYVVRRCDGADAADVVSETFTVAWRRWSTVPPEPETRPWLFGVARNLINNDRRRLRRRSRFLRAAAEHLAPVVDQIQAEASIDDRSWLADAMATLSADDRELLIVTAWDGLTAAEAAVMLGISHDSARQRLHRARRRLRSALAATAYDRTGEDSR